VTITRTSDSPCDLPAPRLPGDAAGVETVRGSGAQALARRLDDAARAPRRAPLAALAALGVVAGTAVVAGPALAVLVALLALPVLGVVHQRDRDRRTVTTAYAQSSSRHECLVAMWERHRISATVWEPAVWEIAPQGVHHTVARRVDGPRHLRADVALPTLAGSHRDVAFLPDRVVIREGRDHHVLGYDDLEATATVRERAEGGRLGRLSLRVAGRAVTYDLASVAVAHELAAALRAMRGTALRAT
jgi:hypothetical protein